MLIDCHECVMQGTDACQDCVVTFLLDAPGPAVTLDGFEAEALRNLAEAGLIAPLRLIERNDEGTAAAAG
jgi:hypothetical protein